MSETREQFIKRITTIAADQTNPHYEGSTLMIDMPTAAEAVYAEALRDILPGLTGPSLRYVKAHVAERGIDLERE